MTFLFAAGISPKDIFDCLDKKIPEMPRSIYRNLPEENMVLEDNAVSYEIPKKYIPEVHPQRTRLLCWHCSLQFSGTPKFYVTGLPNEIAGNFCSWSCSISYVRMTFNAEDSWNIIQWTTLLKAKIENTELKAIQAAPSPTIMQMYCGSAGISIQAYQKLLQ
jgi:hypothetical protein